MKKIYWGTIWIIVLCLGLSGCAKTQVIDSKSVIYKEYNKSNKKSNNKYTIVIDAGHQTHGNSKLEPIGPGAKQKKPKVSQGTQGVSSKVPEYKVNLQVALKLQTVLEDKGYKVVMVRTTNDVDISNAERAAIANQCDADAFIRIHCNGSENSKTNGALTMCQTKKNPYCGELHSKSRLLSDCVLKSLCKTTGAKNKGVTETDSMSGINWCQVPVTIVEMGFMSNPKEDKKLVSDQYQDKLAKGIAVGIDSYFQK